MGRRPAFAAAEVGIILFCGAFGARKTRILPCRVP
jgi:hypothetical protein